MVINYDLLEPGLYIQRGAAVKRIGEIGDPLSAALTGHYYNEPEKLASAVGWVFIALEKRAAQIKELFRYGQWLDGHNNEIEQLPFVFNFKQDLPRVDLALQLHGQAFLLKQRQGRRLLGLRWLDPTTIQPDPDSATVVPGGARFERYWRFDPLTNVRSVIDANDIIHFIVRGMPEIEPGVTAGLATKMAANILLGMGEMFSTFYENNALPIMLVEVPAGTSDEDIAKTRSSFWRIFNPRRGSRENRTIGVREGIKITPLSINPENLDAIPLEEQQIKAILTAHDIPYEIVASSANYAVSQDRRRDFVGSIGQRIEYMADVLNADPDIRALRLRYFCDVEQHWSMKRDEADAALAAARWMQAGMQPWAAAYLMGITEDQFPGELLARGIWRDVDSSGATGLGGVMQSTDDEMIRAAKDVELAQFRRWYKKRLGGDVDKFEARYITKADKLLVADELLRGAWEAYP